jgi:hypothetical protein
MPTPVRLRSLLLLAGAAVLLGCGFLGSCSRTSSRSVSGCARARVGGRLVCLRAGVFCRPRFELVYRSYGLTCRPAAGGYRLRERNFIAPANP